MVQEDAEYYQAHKDDPREWGEPQPAPKSRRRRLVAMISVRFTPEEEQTVRRAAQETGKSVSNFIRQAALKAAGHRQRSSREESLADFGREPTTTTSMGKTTEIVTGSTSVQLSVPSSLPDAILATS
jgi:hypothetical protein